eukprot:1159038-Pelagomonas_calceolata.AAC.7
MSHDPGRAVWFGLCLTLATDPPILTIVSQFDNPFSSKPSSYHLEQLLRHAKLLKASPSTRLCKDATRP